MNNDILKGLNNALAEHSAETDILFKRYFPSEEKAMVLDAAAYGLFGKGKRLRSFLLRCGADRYEIWDENTERLAVALEMIHAYSLVHDDLPCMDNDDMRRGKPSCHKVYGEAGALLAGDCLLNLAYEVLLGGQFTRGYQKACAAVAGAAGYGGMIDGQYVELASEFADERKLLSITGNKTCALFRAAVTAPALIAERPQSEIDLLTCFAEAFGTAFQIADDLLDEETDKTEEMNFVTVLGRERASEELEAYSEKALEALTKLGFSGGFEERLVTFNRSRRV